MPHSLYDIRPLQPLIEAGYVLLTPNYRLARRIKGEWDRQQAGQGRTAWRPLQVAALENWLQRQWERALRAGAVPDRTVLDQARATEIWQQVIAADCVAHGQYSLLQPGAAADLAAQARDNLRRWQVETASEAVRSEFRVDDDCTTFLRWLDAFEQRLSREHLATGVDCMVDLLGSGPRGITTRIALIEFDDIAPLYQSCLDALATEQHEVRLSGETAQADARSFADKSRELEAVAGWAAAMHRDEPDATVGIILADMAADRAPLEYLLRREFDCLGENYNSLPVNFSTGITLDRAPVVRDALRILSTTAQRIPVGEVAGLLRSRFTGHSDGQSDRSVRLLEELYADGLAIIDSGQLRHAAQQVRVGEEIGLELGLSLRRLAELRLHRKRQAPSAWVEDLSAVLDLWGWPGRGSLDSLEYQQVEAWYGTLEAFAGYDLVYPELSLQDALQVLRRCCQGQVSQPQTVDTTIQVLGPLEGAGLQFDALWLCGLQGSRWPAPARPNPFVPLAIQRRRDMPHASSQREWRFAATLFQQYLHGSKRLTASYSRHIDGVPELPSPLLEGVSATAHEGETALPPAWVSAWETRQLHRVDDSAAPPVSEAELHGLSRGSGLLDDQSNCPFRAFVKRRLAVEPLRDNHSGLSAADRGSLLHSALYVLWGELESSDRLAALDDGAARELVARCVRTALEHAPGSLRRVAGRVCLQLEQQRLQGLLLEWLEVERQRDPFRVLAREEAVEGDIAGIPLRLRVDRVDELAGGERLVIDYKSGRNSLADWLGERPRQPQLPLYGTVGDAVSGLAFAEVRPRESRLLGVGTVAGVPGVKSDIAKAVGRYSPAGDWPALQAQWRANLERLAGAFLAGEASVDPLSGACNYCGLQALCRVELAPGEEP